MLILFLGLDLALAWMTIQGAYTYLGAIWQELAGKALPSRAIEEHAHQFLILRGIQMAAWLAIGVLVLIWLTRRRATAGEGTGAGARWSPLARVMAALAAAAGLAHGLALVLAADPFRPLDLGGPLQLLMVGALLEIAAAATGILLVRRFTARLEGRRRAPPAGPSTSP